MVTPSPLPVPRQATVAIAAMIGSAEVLTVCERIEALLAECGARLVVCDVTGLSAADVRAVDVLARVTLVAKRSGCEVQVVKASPALRELLALAGLNDVVPCAPASGVEVRG